MNDPVSSLIVRQMDFAAARHKVLAHNLANIGTPGAVAKGPSFEGTLGKAVSERSPQSGQDPAVAPLSGAAEKALPGVPPGDEGQPGAPEPMDTAEGFEMQMARLADNTGRFSALARILTIREKAYENAIRGR